MKSSSLLIYSGVVVSAGLLVGAQRAAVPTATARTKGVALKGSAIDGRAAIVPAAGAKVTVVALTSTTCPLCLKYGPALARIEDEYAKKGVRFVFVNPETDATAKDAKATVGRLKLDGPYVAEGGPTWAKRLGAKTTTETFVIDAAGKVRYQGAIDDQYALGAALPKPRHRYLADALDSVLAGRSPKVPSTSAPGCALALALSAPAVPGYHGAVETIVQKNCLSCHRTGGSAPFALDSYAAVKARAPMVEYVVKNGIMPPWYAAKGTGPWANDRTLSDGDKSALLAWAAKGTPKGEPKLATAAPTFASSWTIGKPDAEFAIPNPVAVKAEGTMPYVDIDVPTNYGEDRWVQRIEILPSARQVVHHVLVFARVPADENAGSASGRILSDGKGGRLRRLADENGLGGFFGGYVPGNSALVYPAGFAKRLPKGTVLRFQIHYTPNGTATSDRTRIGVVFSPKAPEHEVMTTALANLFFRIPPREASHPVVAELTSPVEARILSFLPHMHLRGKAAKYEIVRKDGGARETLLHVPKYDFNWQLNYMAKEPMTVHAGDKLIYTAVYDNSAGNPANPDPNRAVGWGEQTYDEMHLGYIEFYIPALRPQ